MIFNHCILSTNCISIINNTQINDTQDIDVVIQMHNLIEYSNNFSEKSGILWSYCRDEPAINAGKLISLVLMQIMLLQIWLKLKNK